MSCRQAVSFVGFRSSVAILLRKICAVPVCWTGQRKGLSRLGGDIRRPLMSAGVKADRLARVLKGVGFALVNGERGWETLWRGLIGSVVLVVPVLAQAQQKVPPPSRVQPPPISQQRITPPPQLRPEGILLGMCATAAVRCVTDLPLGSRCHCKSRSGRLYVGVVRSR
jgi:hypothetical protein